MKQNDVLLQSPAPISFKTLENGWTCKSNLTSNNKIPNTKLSNITSGYIFDENSRNIFTAGLLSQDTKEKINQLIDSNELTAINMAAEIKNILLNNSKNCKLRTKKLPPKKFDFFPEGGYTCFVS